MASSLQAEVLSLTASMEVVVHESIGSTNEWCLQQCKAGKLMPFACFAEEQVSGKGRRGKQWYMAPKSNIAMSLAWPFVVSRQPLHLLSLTIALAMVEMLESLGLKHVQIKWPNDVYVQDKKIAGILIETRLHKAGRGAGHNNVAAVIGVGLNYDMSMFDNNLSDDVLSFTDVCEELVSQSVDVRPKRAVVASQLLQAVASACQNYTEQCQSNLAKFQEYYDYCKNKNLEIVTDDQAILTGVAQGVNDDAELLVLIDGKQCVFNSADVSVKASGAG